MVQRFRLPDVTQEEASVGQCMAPKGDPVNLLALAAMTTTQALFRASRNLAQDSDAAKKALRNNATGMGERALLEGSLEVAW